MNTSTQSGGARIIRWRTWIGLLGISTIVLLAYFPALRLSFVGDDWIFYELAGRLNLQDYLIKYFDPRVQTAWYRPLQGMLFRLAYDVFGTDPIGYHLGNVLFHLANCFLLFAVTVRATGRPRVGWVAAFLFASFPVAVESVFKPGVVDPLTTFCSLIAIWFWLAYLRRPNSRDYWLAFAFFVLALSSKEIAVTLPITFFLIDRLWAGAPTTGNQLLRRYLWFAIVIVGYFPIEYIVVNRSVFVHQEGYAPSLSILSNLVDYLGSLAWPWSSAMPLNYFWLAVGAAVLAYIVFLKRAFVLLPLVVSAVLAILPVVSFPFVSYRFVYMSLASSSILLALALDFTRRRAPSVWSSYAPALALGILVVAGSLGVSNAAIDFGEFARVARVPFRNVSQAHRTFPDDSLVYFIHAPVPGPNLSGMFFWRYSTRVSIGADDMGGRAGLHDHQNVFINYFDEQGNQKELRVELGAAALSAPNASIDFAEPIRLDGYELANAKVKRGEALVLLLYWRAMNILDKDYTVSLRLVDTPAGQVIANYDGEPRSGKSPTSSWTPGELVIDPRILVVSKDVPTGSNYRLELGLYDSSAMRWLSIRGRGNDQEIRIEPLSVIE